MRSYVRGVTDKKGVLMDEWDMLRNEREQRGERFTDQLFHCYVNFQTDCKGLHELHCSAAMTNYDALYHNDMSHSPVH
jgi:hypothetical protein